MSAEARCRAIFRAAHAAHAGCRTDEWLLQPCRARSGRPLPRPIVWSRRNGPWQRTTVLWIGAAPGNAGGRGRGVRGAHGTRIPFGGDVAGANLDLLLASIGLDRNTTFITAALNQLPARGGGEPSARELSAPVGSHPSSVHVLRDTVLATGPRLVVALGNVALRTLVAAVLLDDDPAPSRLPGQAALRRLDIVRGVHTPWPAQAPPSAAFLHAWHTTWPDSNLPGLLLCYHPSAQNMSPFAGSHTVFHRRMIDTRDALRAAARAWLGWTPRAPAAPARGGIYDLPEWRTLIAPYHERLLHAWYERGVR